MKYKMILSAGLCLLATIGVAAVASYAVVSFDIGEQTIRNVGVAKVEQVQVTGSAVADGTVVLSVIRDAGASTNELVSVECSSGAVTYTETNTVFIAAGDLILRNGTATNGTCKVIVSQ